MSQDSDAHKQSLGFGKFLNIFSPETPKQSTTPGGSSQQLPDANGDSYRLHSMPEPTPKRNRMDPKYNLQPSSWNSPAVNQRLLQSKQSETRAQKASTSAVMPHPRTPANDLISKPLPATTGRRVVRVRRPSVFLSPPIKASSDSNEGKRMLWKDLSEKTSFAKPRSEEEKYVGFRNGERMPAANRLYNKCVMTKRPLLLEASDESNDRRESVAPKSKRTRVSFDPDTLHSRQINEAAPAPAVDYDSRNNTERNSGSPYDEEEEALPFKSMFTEPLVLHDYMGYRDPDVPTYCDPMDDYKHIKKSATSKKVDYVQEESPPWECKHCQTANPNDESTCSQCKKPRTTKDKAIGWGNLFANQKPTWKCPTCLLANDFQTDQCSACETLRDDGHSRVPNAASADSTSKTTGTKVAEIKEEPPKLTFGVPNPSSHPSSSAPQPFSLGSTPSQASPKAPSISFGSAPVSSDAATKSQSFSFGKAPAPSDSSQNTPSFTFGKRTDPIDPPTRSQDLDSSPTPSAGPDTSAMTDTSGKPFSFGGTPATSDNATKPLSFGGTPVTLDNATTSSSFGGTSATSDTSVKPFSFGGTSATSNASVKPFSFGGTSATSDTSVQPFSFGGTDTTVASGSAPKPQSFPFGNAPTPSGSTSNQPPAASFGGQIPPSVSGDEKDACTVQPSATAAPTAPFSFGGSLSSNSPPIDAANLGQNSTLIGASSFAGHESNKPFQLGAGATADTPDDGDARRKRSKPLFGFGSSGQLPPISENPSSDSGPFIAGNSFDQTSKGDNSTSSGFVFGSKQATLPSNANSTNESTSAGQQLGATSTFSSGFGVSSGQSGTHTVANSSAPTFGSSVSASNDFGTSTGLPPFGNAAHAPATFGAPAQPAFGTSAPAFSAPSLSAGFGSAPVPPFGGQPAPVPASTAPMFGSVSNPSTSAPAFGTPTFGAPNPFGSNAPAPAGFGRNAAPATSAPTFGGFTPAPAPTFGQTGQAPTFGAPAASQSFGQPPSFSAPQGFGGQASSFGTGAADSFGAQTPSFGAGAADGGFNIGSGGAPAKRRIVRARRK